ncbi:hypothetical protein L1887_16742 [Cichorium endivia]|nr:hypothetical protein L1887_16742 [Cichorium endivia]
MDHQPPRARIPLALFILVIVSLFVIFLGSDRTRSRSIVAITQNCDPRVTTSFMPSRHTDGVDFDGEKMYMSDDFIKMMWQRTLFLGDVLKRGYNFIFTDTDVLWLRDPFPRLNLNDSIDLHISVDKFNGDQWSERDQLINTGFYMIKSNNRTIALFDEWYARKDNSTGMKEQDVLLELMSKGAFERLGLRVRFLDTIFFSGICEDSRDVTSVVTVHANCCRSIKAKEEDLKSIMHDWQRFKVSATDQTLQFSWSNHSACLDSWKR